jgi:hypothetical protein
VDYNDDNNPWVDEEDRLANYFITTNPMYNRIRLPEIIKIKDCQPGEVPFWRKRSFPKAARIHKKNEDTDPNRFFLSELILYMGFTDEKELGSNDEQKCRQIYFDNFEAIQFVKRKLLPFAQGVEEARYNGQQAMQNNEQLTNNIGEVLDPEQEQEIEDCQEGEDLLHPDFIQLNPDDLEIDSNLNQVRKTLRKIQIKTDDERLEEARQLDHFQKKALNVAVNFAVDIIISRKGKISYPKAPFIMVHGGAGSGKSTLINVISQHVHHILRRDGDDPDCPYIL